MALPKGYKRIYPNFIERSFARARHFRNLTEHARDGKDWHNYEQHGWPDASLGWAIAVSAYPLFLMGKDVADTFKPYKDWSQVRTNGAQPLYGIGNLLYALWRALVFVVHLLIDVIGLPFWLGRSIYRYCKGESFEGMYGHKVEPTFYRCFILEPLVLLTHFLQVLGHLVRGSLQIATTPMTWCLKMPLRGALTAIYGQPIVLMSDNMEQLLQIGNSSYYVTDSDYAHAQILRKLNRANSRGQKIGVDLADLSCTIDSKGIVIFDEANAKGRTLFQKVSEARETLAKASSTGYKTYKTVPSVYV